MTETAEERARNRGATARRLVAEMAPYRARILIGFGFVVLGAVAQAAGPYLIGRAIDQAILRGDRSGLTRIMLALLVVYVVGALASRGQVWQVGAIGQHVLASLRARLFDRFQRLPLGFYDRRPVGDLMSRVINDVDTLNQLLSQGLTQLVGSLFSLIGILIAMVTLNLPLALVSFLIIPVMLIVTTSFARRARKAFRMTRETVGDVTAELQEEITGVREAQAFNRTEENIARFRKRNAANRTANVQAVAITSAFSPTIDVLSTLATALVIGYGGYLVFHGNLTVGLLAAFLIYVQQFFRPIQLASQVYTQLQAALAGGERIYAILDEEPEPADPPGTPALGQVAGAIAFEHVTFAYNLGTPVLHDVSFQIAAGQTVALVGQTGAGKTTIANLIPRFYDVTSGVIAVDGQDVRAVTRQSLRRQIAIVLQESFLFSGTIAANIGYGRLDATREQIEAAARAVDAHAFIAALPDGYDTALGAAGGTLSQGQRQLLAFARAILADPRILILDEATSNIDTRTEATIQRALGTLLAGRTSIVIAHRLSTIRNADLILVVEGGAIVERGTHDELLRAGGRYADLSRRQFRDIPTLAEAS
ncbi:MAG: ABC transporter ATP-binding protein/permease [Chloroflexota bacterium]|nr:ABC transporter ATP-binding protein/permease [Chloroflexota bacterium]MDQ6907818.1 ABC transporter ATP-binding protein/permease [Chloroflexota bacterium]